MARCGDAAAGACVVVVLGAFAWSAQAQGTARVWLESSLDQQHWIEGERDVAQGATVFMRLRVSIPESGLPAPSIGFAGFTADLWVENAGSGDRVLDIVRPAPFDFPRQTLVATRFGNTIKLDDSRDTFPPGMGVRGISAGQGVAAFTPKFSSANPVTVLTFVLTVDDQVGPRGFDIQHQISPIEPPPPVRWVRYYTTPNGAQGVAFAAEQFDARINVIPAAGSEIVTLFAPVVGVSRRFRPSEPSWRSRCNFN
ncbi:MAG: hypothetical protein SFZ23_04620 [Planctomycetota bacterium]|nr:hypothetical protein [Planctomycetota bacterium]